MDVSPPTRGGHCTRDPLWPRDCPGTSAVRKPQARRPAGPTPSLEGPSMGRPSRGRDGSPGPFAQDVSLLGFEPGSQTMLKMGPQVPPGLSKSQSTDLPLGRSAERAERRARPGVGQAAHTAVWTQPSPRKTEPAQMGPGCYLGIQSPSNQPNTGGRTRPQTPPSPPFPGSCGCQALQRPQLLITAERNEEALVVSGCGAPQGRPLRPAFHPHSQGPGAAVAWPCSSPTATPARPSVVSRTSRESSGGSSCPLLLFLAKS